MRRYIVLLLITGTVWAQTDLDKLVLKNGTEYLGEYSRKDFKLYTYNLDDIDQEIIYSAGSRIRDVETGPDGYVYIALEDPGRIIRFIPE